MIPSSEPVVPVRPRLPDWVFALGLAASIVLLILAAAWTPDSARFTEPRTIDDVAPEPEPEPDMLNSGSYTALAELRPEEQPPPVETMVVEEFGYDVSEDGRHVTWGASIHNAHNDYAATFELEVTVEGTDFRTSGSQPTFYGSVTLPGGRSLLGGAFYGGEDMPSDVVATVKVTNLEWLAFEGGTRPEVPEPLLTSRVDAVVDAAAGPRDQAQFSVTFANTSAYAIEPHLTAIFYRADGTPTGGASVRDVLPLPPGESTREIRFWSRDVPAGADLSLTEFAPAW